MMMYDVHLHSWVYFFVPGVSYLSLLECTGTKKDPSVFFFNSFRLAN